MKKLIILVSLFFSYSYAQIQPVVPDFLITGDDNPHSTFIQTAPSLYATNYNNFVVTWIDYREGESSIYAQKFDKLGNKIGANFKTNSNSGAFLNNDGYLLTLHKEQVPYFEDSYLYLTARLKNTSNQEIIEQQIYSAYVPWCGTGFISGDDIITASDNCFYFLTNFGGNVSLVKINEDGVVKNINVRLENLNYITQVTGSATPDCNFFFAWINGVENDSLGTGLYATFINPGDSVIIPKILISEVIDSVGIWEYVGNYTMKSIVLNDSTYKLFWLNNSTSMLYSIKLNINGEILSDIDSLLIPGSGHPYASVSKVVLTNKTEEGFYLFISSSYYDSNNDVYTNSFVKYNDEGEQIGDIMTEQTTSLFALNLFNLGAGNFFRASSDMKDVFLDQLEYFNLFGQ